MITKPTITQADRVRPVDVFRACLIANGLKDPEFGAAGMLANSPPDERAYCSAIADALNVVLTWPGSERQALNVEFNRMMRDIGLRYESQKDNAP